MWVHFNIKVFKRGKRPFAEGRWDNMISEPKVSWIREYKQLCQGLTKSSKLSDPAFATSVSCTFNFFPEHIKWQYPSINQHM